METRLRNQRNVYLMGFMCSGKTKVGSLLAERLGWSFKDTDECIVKEKGMSIPEIFEKEGESVFRKLERSCIQRISQKSGYVIALGGGAVIDPENWDCIFHSGMTITLSYPSEILAIRLARKNDRPLMNHLDGIEPIKRIQDLLDKREHYYRRADLVLHFNQEVEALRIAESLVGFIRGRL